MSLAVSCGSCSAVLSACISDDFCIFSPVKSELHLVIKEERHERVKVKLPDPTNGIQKEVIDLLCEKCSGVVGHTLAFGIALIPFWVLSRRRIMIGGKGVASIEAWRDRVPFHTWKTIYGEGVVSSAKLPQLPPPINPTSGSLLSTRLTQSKPRPYQWESLVLSLESKFLLY